MSKNIKEYIKVSANELGFSDIGFAAITNWDNEFEYFEQWLDEKRHAQMLFMERNKHLREYPKKILDTAKTVIVTATNYFTPFYHIEKKGYGKISRYAWGEDYHNIIKKMQKKLIARIQQIAPNSENKYFVDSSPVLEKQWAIRSGIGYQGKNGLIIHPKYGTWIFLGVILTSLDITPSKPFTKDLCKKCTKCIDNCPTSAIVRPKVIDANKCIAYHTCETKPDEGLPYYIRKNLNGWIYGCDDCQNVCPWNKNAIPTTNKAFYPKKEKISIEIQKVFDMTDDEFKTEFHKNPIQRIKLKGLQRNAREIKNN